MTRYVVAEAGEIPPGGRKIVELEGRSIGVFFVNGEYFALLNRCPHQAGPLCNGKLWSALEAAVPGEYRTSRDGEILTCPWHGWEFDLRTGLSLCEPRRLRVRAYPAAVEPGGALVGAGAAKVAHADQAADEHHVGPHTGHAPAATDDIGLPPGRVRGPYVATTYPVTAEGRYVVVDLGGRAAEPRGDTGGSSALGSWAAWVDRG